jgi:hypothetical protein
MATEHNKYFMTTQMFYICRYIVMTMVISFRELARPQNAEQALVWALT